MGFEMVARDQVDWAERPCTHITIAAVITDGGLVDVHRVLPECRMQKPASGEGFVGLHRVETAKISKGGPTWVIVISRAELWLALDVVQCFVADGSEG